MRRLVRRHEHGLPLAQHLIGMAQATREHHQELAAAAGGVERERTAAWRQLPDLRGELVGGWRDQVDATGLRQRREPALVQGLVLLA
ncbi:MAG: hypothetical protein IPM01_29245 [Burkholderiaceae bacterium]|nr:hypothetical protein [Burkholderiaceae bacterium]